MKTYIKLLYIATLLLIFSNCIYALDSPFAEYKEYSKTATTDLSDYVKSDLNTNYGVITIKDTFLWIPSGKIAEYSLTKNTDYCLINCEAEGKVTLYSDYVLFDDVKFKKLTGQQINIKYQYYLFEGYEDVINEVPIYKEICETSKNLSSICYKEINGYEKQTTQKEIWKEYNGEELSEGDYRWKIKGQKPLLLSVDFIPILEDIEFSEWAVWNSSYELGLVSYYGYNDDSLNDSMGRYNLNAGASGSFVNEGKFEEGRNYSSATGTGDNATGTALMGIGTGDFSINFWIKTTTATHPLIVRIGGDEIWDNGGSGFGILLQSSETKFYKQPSGGADVGGSGNIADGNWHMITYVREGTGANEFKTYVDGSFVEQNTNADDMNDNDATLHIGNHIVQGSNGIITMDEIAFYNRSLSSGEIADLTSIFYTLPLKTTINISLTNYPNNTFITILPQTIFFNSTALVTNGNFTNATLYVWNASNYAYKNFSEITGYPNVTGKNLSLTFNNDGSYKWNYEYCVINLTLDTICEFSTTNKTFSIDATYPTINITSPFGEVDYGYENKTLYLNWSISEVNIDTIWYEYNGVNTTLIGLINYTIFNQSMGINYLRIYANDTFGNVNNSLTIWNYRVFENSINYSSIIYEGQNNPITYNVSLNGSISSILINSFGINYSVSTTSLGGNEYLVYLNQNVPITDINHTQFYLIIDFLDKEILTRGINQTLIDISIKLCNNTFNNSFVSFNLKDEKNIGNSLNGSGEYVISASTPYSNDVYILNGTFSSSEVNLCSSINLTATNLTYYSGGKIKYTATGFSNENYNFIKQNIPNNITLYLLNTTYVIPFKITYYGETNLPTPNHILELWKEYQYINDYLIVEAPISSTTGEVLFNIDSQNSKYKVKVYDEDYVLKRIFENQIFYCDTALYSICEADLSGIIETESLSDPNKIFSFSITSSNESLNISYEYTDGSSKQTNAVVTKIVNEMETLVYNSSIYSSNGRFDIPVSSSKLNEKYTIKILSDSDLVFSGDYVPVEKTSRIGYLLSAILLLTCVGMAMTNGVAVVLMAMMGFLLAGLFLFINGIEIGWNSIGYLSPLIIVVALLIWKFSKMEK